MLKLLIVDDEPYTCRGLLHFDWAGYGIEIVGEADGGTSALEQSEQLKPDIVLTDIRMPDMDGFEMIRRIRETRPEVKFIVMSAYDDIGYFKSALRLSTQDYILKPIDFGELGLAVRKAAHLISHEAEEKSMIQKMSRKILQSMPALREKFLMALVCDGIEGQANIEERIRFLELNLSTGGDYCVFVIYVDDGPSKRDGFSGKDRQLTTFAVANICDELINCDFTGYSFEYRPGEYACLLQYRTSGGEEEKLYPLFVRIPKKLEECLGLKVTIGVGPIVHGLGNVSKSFSSACGNVSRRLFLGKNRIIIDSLDFDESDGTKFDLSEMDRVAELLKSGNEEMMANAVGSFSHYLAQCKQADTQYCLNISYQLILTARHKQMELGIFPKDIRMDENAVLHGIHKKESRRGEVVIRSEKVGPDIYFWIWDDGVGMDQKTISRVLNSPFEENRNSYGLFNVNERLKLTYGEDYGIRIDSEINAFTEVKIKIKVNL